MRYQVITWTRGEGHNERRELLAERSGVRIPYAPPMQDNPNLRPIGQGFGFLVFIKDIEV